MNCDIEFPNKFEERWKNYSHILLDLSMILIANEIKVSVIQGRALLKGIPSINWSLH